LNFEARKGTSSLKRRLLWIFLGGASFLLHLILGKDSAIAESVYSRGFYAGLRWVWDHTLGFSPVPVLFLIVLAVVLWGAWKLSRFLSKTRPRRRGRPWLTKILRAGLLVASWVGGLVFFFYLLWGFNYNRIGVELRLRLNAVPLDAAALRTEAEWASGMLAETRAAIPGASAAALGPDFLPAGLEAGLRESLSGVLEKEGYSAPGRVRVRPFWPRGWMMRFSGTGMYIPFFGEGYYEANLLAFEKPFTIAHEMVHGLGIADEGGASFFGFLACLSSSVPVVRYSGFLAYASEVLADLARASGEDFRKIAAGIPEGVKADLRAAQENWSRYRGPLQNAGRAIYEKYLKSQGVKEGLLSYDRFVLMVAAYRKAAYRIKEDQLFP